MLKMSFYNGTLNMQILTDNTLEEAKENVKIREITKDVDDGHIIENRFLFGWGT